MTVIERSWRIRVCPTCGATHDGVTCKGPRLWRHASVKTEIVEVVPASQLQRAVSRVEALTPDLSADPDRHKLAFRRGYNEAKRDALRELRGQS